MKYFNYLSRRAWIRLISLRSIIVCNRDIKSAGDGAPSNLQDRKTSSCIKLNNINIEEMFVSKYIDRLVFYVPTDYCHSIILQHDQR